MKRKSSGISLKKNRSVHSPSNLLSKNTYFIFSGCLILYFLFMKSMDKIINYPFVVLWGLSAIVFIFMSIYTFKRFVTKLKTIDNSTEKIGAIIIQILYFAIISWLITGILLIPFNYYNIYKARDTLPETKYLEIKGLVARPRNNKIFYEFNGKMNVLYGKINLMNEIYAKGNFKDYYLTITVHKGLLGSYLVEDWDIIRRE